jgi:L-ribulose-5-phosphate 4-epimerase
VRLKWWALSVLVVQAKEPSKMSKDPKWARIRDEILVFCHRLQQERLVWYTAGNISSRVEGELDLVAVTPTCVPYDTMVPDDIVIMTVHGDIVDGARKPTSEVPLHTLIYLDRPDVGGVVHTHSTAGMAMAAMGRTLPPILTGLVSAAGGSVETAPYARTGTAEMANFTASALVDRSACFLRHHGVLAIGSTVEQAYNTASVVEGAADAYLRAAPLGDVPELSPEEVEWMRIKWKKRWPALADKITVR